MTTTSVVSVADSTATVGPSAAGNGPPSTPADTLSFTCPAEYAAGTGTFLYVAAAPDTDGLGCADGHDSDIQSFPERTVASVRLPPPETLSPPSAAAGDNDPPLPATRSALAATHDEPCRTRRGTHDST